MVSQSLLNLILFQDICGGADHGGSLRLLQAVHDDPQGHDASPVLEGRGGTEGTEQHEGSDHPGHTDHEEVLWQERQIWWVGEFL